MTDMRIEVAGSTHVGMKRSHNEDSYLLLPEHGLFCVADGMGGHSSGEIASRIAIEEIAEFFRVTASDTDATWPYKMEKSRNYDENRLATGIKLANMRIFERASSEQKFKGMGTTIVSLHFAANLAYLAHVGDSRVYFHRAGVLKQLTEDHSLLNEYLKTNKLSQDEIDSFPQKNVIVRALGMKDSVQVDVGRVEPQDGDTFLLCSDGLSGMLPDSSIQGVLNARRELEAACAELIELANAAGGNDNVTCVLARWRAD